MSMKLQRKGLNKLKANLRHMNNSSTQTGFFNAKPHDKNNTMATIALWQEYGTERLDQDGIPERPFMSSTYLKGGYKKDITKLARDILTGRSTTKVSLDRLGKKIARDMQLTLWSWSVPPNAPSTIKRKGFDFPLVETTALFHGIKSRTKIVGGRV